MFFEYILRIYTSFYLEIACQNSSSKHEVFTTNVANRTPSLTRVLYMCFSFIELVFWTLATRDIVYWEIITPSVITITSIHYQVWDMTAFVIHYCIVTHIKITIQSLYCHPMPYCDHNTDSPFLFYYFFYIPPLWTY